MPARPESKFPYYDDISVHGFMEEALFGFGTGRTHRFDDYTKGSYHVQPRDLARALPAAAGLYRLDLKAVAVIGPYGPIWAYDVITVIQDKDCLRVNWLLMPHARITVKRSGCIDENIVWSAFAELQALSSNQALTGGGNSCLVVTKGESSGLASFDCYSSDSRAEVDRLNAALERLGSGLEVTYNSYPPVDDEDEPKTLPNR